VIILLSSVFYLIQLYYFSKDRKESSKSELIGSKVNSITVEMDKSIAHAWPPSDLSATANSQEVELKWTVNSDLIKGGTLKNYNVYRKKSEWQCKILKWFRSNFQRTTCFEKLGDTTEGVFVDQTVKKGKKYIYGVTAVDNINNESQLSEIIEVNIP